MWNFHDDVATFGLEGGHLKGVAGQSGAHWRFTLGSDSLRNGDQQLSVAAHMVACGPNDAYGQYLFSARDNGLTSGTYGFYLQHRTQGGLTVTFDNLVARAVSNA